MLNQLPQCIIDLGYFFVLIQHLVSFFSDLSAINTVKIKWMFESVFAPHFGQLGFISKLNEGMMVSHWAMACNCVNCIGYKGFSDLFFRWV